MVMWQSTYPSGYCDHTIRRICFCACSQSDSLSPMNLSYSKDSAGSSMLPLLRSLNGMEGCKYSVEALGSALSGGWSQKGIILPHLLHLCKSVNPTSNLCQQQTFTAGVHQDLNITSSFCICMTHYTSSCYSQSLSSAVVHNELF